jgi:putative acetyltransferase
MTIKIRSESPSDVTAIAAVTAAAFLNAPHTSHTEQFIANALRKAGMLSVSLVAEDRGEIVGHVAISPVSISDGNSGWYILGPIAVAPDRQGLGIGSQLMERALVELGKLAAAGCVLVGNPNYYRRFGFSSAQKFRLASSLTMKPLMLKANNSVLPWVQQSRLKASVDST